LIPYQVAGLIRQETVFISAPRSSAKALVDAVAGSDGYLTARSWSGTAISEESLYEPRLNIQLGTANLRDQIDKFGRIDM